MGDRCTNLDCLAGHHTLVEIPLGVVSLERVVRCVRHVLRIEYSFLLRLLVVY